MTNPTHSQDQDLRTALEPDHEFKSHPDVFWPAVRCEKMFEFRKDDRGGYSVGQTVRLRLWHGDTGYADAPPLDRRVTNILRGGEFGLQEGFCILSLAPLAAPPRPVDAERVSTAIYNYLRVCSSGGMPRDLIEQVQQAVDSAGRLGYFDDVASPAHSPDKAATREGVDRRALIDAMLVALTEADENHLAEHMTVSFTRNSWREVMGKALAVAEAALAPKPTGTEASRGVDAGIAPLVELYHSLEAILSQQNADYPDHEEVIIGRGRSRFVLCEYRDIRDAVRRLDVAALTPSAPIAAPVPEGVDEIATDALEILPLVAERLAEHEGDNDEVLDDLIDRFRSALAPTPASDVPGDAQTQEGGR